MSDRTPLEARLAYWGDGLHFVDVDPADLRRAAALLAEQRRALEAWEKYHDVQSYAAYTTAINLTQDVLARG